MTAPTLPRQQPETPETEAAGRDWLERWRKSRKKRQEDRLREKILARHPRLARKLRSFFDQWIPTFHEIALDPVQLMSSNFGPSDQEFALRFIS
jgi:hypothetical protein